MTFETVMPSKINTMKLPSKMALSKENPGSLWGNTTFYCVML